MSSTSGKEVTLSPWTGDASTLFTTHLEPSELRKHRCLRLPLTTRFLILLSWCTDEDVKRLYESSKLALLSRPSPDLHPYIAFRRMRIPQDHFKFNVWIVGFDIDESKYSCKTDVSRSLVDIVLKCFVAAKRPMILVRTSPPPAYQDVTEKSSPESDLEFSDD